MRGHNKRFDAGSGRLIGNSKSTAIRQVDIAYGEIEGLAAENRHPLCYSLGGGDLIALALKNVLKQWAHVRIIFQK